MRVAGLLFSFLAVTSATELQRRSPQPQDDPWGDASVAAKSNGSAPTTDMAGMDMSGSSASPAGPGDSMPGMDMAGMNMGSGGHEHAGHGSDMPSQYPSKSGGKPTANGRPSLKDNIADFIRFTPQVRMAAPIYLKPQLSSTNKRTKLRLGPFPLKPKGAQRNQNDIMPSMDMNGQAFLYKIKQGLCADCTILAAKTGLELENGTKADTSNGIYLHHILVSDITKAGVLPVSPCEFPRQPNAANVVPDPFERLSGIRGSGFLGSGDDDGNSQTFFTTPDAKYNSGYFIGKNDDFVFTADIINITPEKQSVYVVLDLEWADGHKGVDATNMMFSVGGCRGRPIALNLTGVARTQSQEYAVLRDSDLITAKGRYVLCDSRLNCREQHVR